MTIRHRLTSLKMAYIKNIKNSVSKNVKRKEFLFTVGRNVVWFRLYEKWDVSKNVTIGASMVAQR